MKIFTKDLKNWSLKLLVLSTFFLLASEKVFSQGPPPILVDTLRFESGIPGNSNWTENGFAWDASVGNGHIDGFAPNAFAGNQSLQFGSPGGILSTCGVLDYGKTVRFLVNLLKELFFQEID